MPTIKHVLLGRWLRRNTVMVCELDKYIQYHPNFHMEQFNMHQPSHCGSEHYKVVTLYWSEPLFQFSMYHAAFQN